MSMFLVLPDSVEPGISNLEEKITTDFVKELRATLKVAFLLKKIYISRNSWKIVSWLINKPERALFEPHSMINTVYEYIYDAPKMQKKDLGAYKSVYFSIIVRATLNFSLMLPVKFFFCISYLFLFLVDLSIKLLLFLAVGGDSVKISFTFCYHL